MEKLSKRRSILILSFIFGCTFASLFIIGVSAEQNKANTARLIVSSDQPAYAVPEGKEKQWENIQEIAKREHVVCREHCGNDLNCLEKCKTAFTSRLDREYQNIIH